MLIKKKSDLTYADVTPKGLCMGRRYFLLGLLATIGAVEAYKRYPRWSQAHEHRLGGGFFDRPIGTLMFNGYGDEVVGMCNGMDLRKYF